MAKKLQNFYWEVINPQKAKDLYNEGKTEIYKLYEDDTESLVVSENDLNDAINKGIELTIERLIS